MDDKTYMIIVICLVIILVITAALLIENGHKKQAYATILTIVASAGTFGGIWWFTSTARVADPVKTFETAPLPDLLSNAEPRTASVPEYQEIELPGELAGAPLPPADANMHQTLREENEMFDDESALEESLTENVQKMGHVKRPRPFDHGWAIDADTQAMDQQLARAHRPSVPKKRVSSRVRTLPSILDSVTKGVDPWWDASN